MLYQVEPSHLAVCQLLGLVVQDAARAKPNARQIKCAFVAEASAWLDWYLGCATPMAMAIPVILAVVAETKTRPADM